MPGVSLPGGADRAAAVPLRKFPKDEFYAQDNELIDLYGSIIGPFAGFVYAALCRNAYGKPTVEYSVRELARVTGMSAPAAARSIKILETIGFLKRLPTSGNRKSQCQLFDLKALAISHGATRLHKSARLAFPPLSFERLNAQVKTVRRGQQGKGKARALSTGKENAEIASWSEFHTLLSVSQRDATVSHLVHQRSTRETQTGTHLLREERRIEESPTPTPTPTGHGDAQQDKDSPSEDEPDRLRRMARAVFTGPMNDLKGYLLDTSRPPIRHLANGGEQWKRFGLDTLAVEAAEWCGDMLALTLSAIDPATAREGLMKYRRTWEPSLRRWYGCEVRWEIRGQS
jgi:hypothetical protein